MKLKIPTETSNLKVRDLQKARNHEQNKVEQKFGFPKLCQGTIDYKPIKGFGVSETKNSKNNTNNNNNKTITHGPW